MRGTLVVGATGHVGGGVARRLLDRGEDVRILVRPASDAAALIGAGATPVSGHLKDPASLAQAMEGVARVVTTANSAGRTPPDTPETVDRAGNLALIDAARAAGAERFVFVSAQGADPASPVPFLAAKGATEQALRESGMSWTILSCDMFMDVWVPLWVLGPLAAGEPVRLVGESARRHFLLYSDDVAALAAAALDVPAAHDANVLVGGPQALSWTDVVSTVEKVTGSAVEVQRIPADRPVDGLPDTVSGLLLGMETYDSPPPLDAEQARAVYGVELTDLESYLRDALGRPPDLH